MAPDPLVELFTYLTTPGICDEEITLFLGVVDASRVPERAGAAAEHEETVPMRVPIDTALAALADGTVRNGPLIIALQWLALNRGRLGEIVRTGASTSLMGAILLAVTGLDPKPWEERFRALAPRRDIRVWPERVGEPGRDRLCLRLACAAWAARALLHLKVDLFARRGRRSSRRRSASAGCAGRAHRRCRPHHADDGVRRAARADASPPPAPLRCPATRARLARARAAAGERGCGRRHGPRRARPRRGIGAAPARFPRRRLEPDAEDRWPTWKRFTGRVGSMPFLRRTEILVCLLPATAATPGMLCLALLRKLTT